MNFQFIKTILSIVFVALISSASFAATKVTWWAESSADTDPTIQTQIVDAFNASQSDVELEIIFKEDIIWFKNKRCYGKSFFSSILRNIYK